MHISYVRPLSPPVVYQPHPRRLQVNAGFAIATSKAAAVINTSMHSYGFALLQQYIEDFGLQHPDNHMQVQALRSQLRERTAKQAWMMVLTYLGYIGQLQSVRDVANTRAHH